MAEQHEKALVPQIRFTGFTDPWEQRKLGDILQERNVRTSDFESNPIFSLTIEDGITPKTDRYERTSLITKTEDLFKIVSPNEFVTNPMNLRFGAFGYNKNSFSVCVSGYYDVFSIDNDKCSGFWNSYFKTSVALKRFDDAATGSLIEKRRVKYSTLCQLIFLMPKGMDEKKRIGAFFDRLDSLITLHQRKYDKLCVLKKSMLDKMFPKGGSLYPEIRFAGFTDPWEQRKLGEVASGFEYGLNAAASDFDGEKKYLRITDIDDQTREFRTDDLSSPDINNPIDDRYLLKEGDILFARTGASVGKTYLYKASDGKTYYAGFLIRAHVSDEADAGFIFQSTLTERYKQFVLLTSQRSGQPGINAQEYSDLLLPLPSLMEQRRIGAFFDRLDSLITLHQRKLELLRNIKKSMLDKMFV